jgi:hypothetical protein
MEAPRSANSIRLPVVDSGLASLFNTQIALMQGEQQALWQRYTAMLVAEAILVGSFGWVQTPTALQVYFAAGFGWALCLAWLLTTVSGYRLCMTRLEAARQFAVVYLARPDDYSDPISGVQWHYRRQSGWLWWLALGIIGLFMLAHTFVLVHYLYYRFVFFEGPR